MNRKPRLDDIDSAKGLAIFLVVLGHLAGGGNLPKNFDWYMAIHYAIYRFHMPFFMFLSGFIFFYTYNPIRTMHDYGRYAVRKFWRFAPAYLLFGGLMIAGKTIGQHVVHVDSPPEGFWHGFVEILIRPSLSHAATLWYIYALLGFQLLLPICLWPTRDRLELLLVVGLLLHFVGSTYLFCFDRMSEHAFVFLAGAYAASYSSAWMALVDKFRNLTLAVFTAILAASVYWYVPSYPISLLSIPALHGLCRLPRWRTSYWLLLFGKYTFIIYLMNTIVIGLEKALLIKFHFWTGGQFVLFSPLLLISGIFVPILLKVYVFPRIPILDRITS
jgi:fucose 4-O-acetylase-like acetyltransferase